MKKILVAEDEASIRGFIVINLQRSGYTVVEAENGRQAIRLYDEADGDFDIALLDIMMPEVDGLQVCKYIRERNNTIGIVMLTAKSQEQDKVQGLMGGADDYVVKPFSTGELIARLDAVYRRVTVNRELAERSKNAGDILESGSFKLNLRSRILMKNEQPVDLTQVEFQIMEYFISNSDVPLSRLDILNHVWGTSYYGDDKIVDVNIRRLRMKIEDDPSVPQHLTTVWGVGYRWIP